MQTLRLMQAHLKHAHPVLALQPSSQLLRQVLEDLPHQRGIAQQDTGDDRATGRVLPGGAGG